MKRTTALFSIASLMTAAQLAVAGDITGTVTLKGTPPKEKDITPYWCVHHGITVSMYYADPDGNQMEFQVDCFASSEQANDFMEHSFAANPVGVEFDPDEWLTKLRAGAPESDFLERRVHEPVSPVRGSITSLVAASQPAN